MAEYIDREALIADIDEEIEHDSKMYTREQNYYIEKGLRIARKDIQSAPAADVVAVVRCKNCSYWDAVKNPQHAGKGICCPPNRSLGGYCTRRGATTEDDYCSQGKRKDGDSK